MSQAEIAGGKISFKGELPRAGFRLRDFALNSIGGRQVRFSDYRGRSNLILVFKAQGEHCDPLLGEIASHYQNIREQDGDVLVIVAGTVVNAKESLQLPFSVLTDPDRQVYGDYGLLRPDPISGIFIADRFGELAASYVGTDVTNATVASILNWLEFINGQCPECEPPEWPLEE